MPYWLEMQSELPGEWFRKGAVGKKKKRENERRMKWREMRREREGELLSRREMDSPDGIQII